jgi:hypothetical protein
VEYAGTIPTVKMNNPEKRNHQDYAVYDPTISSAWYNAGQVNDEAAQVKENNSEQQKYLGSNNNLEIYEGDAHYDKKYIDEFQQSSNYNNNANDDSRMEDMSKINNHQIVIYDPTGNYNNIYSNNGSYYPPDNRFKIDDSDDHEGFTERFEEFDDDDDKIARYNTQYDDNGPVQQEFKEKEKKGSFCCIAAKRSGKDKGPIVRDPRRQFHIQ